MKLACPTQFLAFLLLQLPCRFLFMACQDVFLACRAAMLLTLWLKTGRLPILTGSDQVSSFMYTTVLFAFKYSQFVLSACMEVESWYLTKTGWQVFQDKKVTV